VKCFIGVEHFVFAFRVFLVMVVVVTYHLRAYIFYVYSVTFYIIDPTQVISAWPSLCG